MNPNEEHAAPLITPKPLNAAMNNSTATVLGSIARSAGDPDRTDVGDAIDRGLILLRLLNEHGFSLSCESSAAPLASKAETPQEKPFPYEINARRVILLSITALHSEGHHALAAELEEATRDYPATDTSVAPERNTGHSQVDVLRRALQPFAKLAEKFEAEPYRLSYKDDSRINGAHSIIASHNFITLGDCRAALAALKALSVPEQPKPSNASGVSSIEVQRESIELAAPSSAGQEEGEWRKFWHLFHSLWGNGKEGMYDKGKWEDLQALAKNIEAANASLREKEEHFEKIRELVIATGVTEDEGSTLGMVASICDYVKVCLAKPNAPSDSVKAVLQNALEEVRSALKRINLEVGAIMKPVDMPAAEAMRKLFLGMFKAIQSPLLQAEHLLSEHIPKFSDGSGKPESSRELL